MGATRSTVTGTARCWSSQTWVMPIFSPTIAFVATVGGPSVQSATTADGHWTRCRSGTLARKRSAGNPSGALDQLCPEVPGGLTRRALEDVEKMLLGLR